MHVRQITPGIAIADQPDEADLPALKEAGYVGVVNLRKDGEPDQPLDTAAEGERVRALGMDYLHYGVGSEPLTEAGVGSVLDFLDDHAEAGPVLVHCRNATHRTPAAALRYAVDLGVAPELAERSILHAMPDIRGEGRLWHVAAHGVTGQTPVSDRSRGQRGRPGQRANVSDRPQG